MSFCERNFSAKYFLPVPDVSLGIAEKFSIKE